MRDAASVISALTAKFTHTAGYELPANWSAQSNPYALSCTPDERGGNSIAFKTFIIVWSMTEIEMYFKSDLLNLFVFDLKLLSMLFQ